MTYRHRILRQWSVRAAYKCGFSKFRSCEYAHSLQAASVNENSLVPFIAGSPIPCMEILPCLCLKYVCAHSGKRSICGTSARVCRERAFVSGAMLDKPASQRVAAARIHGRGVKDARFSPLGCRCVRHLWRASHGGESPDSCAARVGCTTCTRSPLKDNRLVPRCVTALPRCVRQAATHRRLVVAQLL